jgi:hypothetical protein
MVRIHPDPPFETIRGAIAQLGERLLCKQEVTGSIPVGSTSRGRGGARGVCGCENEFDLMRPGASRDAIGCSLTIWNRR